MISYCSIPSICKVFIMAYIFALLCGIVLSMSPVFSARKHRGKIAWVFCVFVSSAMLLIYAADVKTAKQNLSVNSFVRWFCDLPVVFPLILITLMTVYVLYVILKEKHKRHNIVTRSSVKEGIDKLDSGLCFAYESGRVILANYIMNELCHSILGRDLQNANVFWDALSSCKVKEDVVCLQAGENPSFRLPDGRVWSFAHSVIDNIIQVSAADTTYLQRLTDELKEKNKELKAINARLVAYGEEVDELTRSKERLETKINIHRSLGQALLVTRHYLIDSTRDEKVPFDIWEKNIAMLSMEIEQPSEEPFEMFIKAAKTAGVDIEINGQLPSREETNNLFALAAAESLVNAVRHADANAMYITFTEEHDMDMVSFTNNGTRPESEITEGGGLGALRKKTERIGGIMKVCHNPEFALIISIPKKGKPHEANNDC